MIRLARPSLDDEDLKAVAEVLASGQLVQGAHVAELERRVMEVTGTAHAVVVSSGTAALHLSLLALGVGPGDRVAVSAYSWVATANAVELCGASCDFVDIEPGAFNMDPAALERVLSASGGSRGRLRAVLPVHAFGAIADMEAIAGASRRHGLAVLEDAACALGATLDERPAGGFGTLGCFSFHPRKTVTTGEGGVVTTDDAELARRIRALRNHGQDPDAAEPDFIVPGFNYRMTDFQAALGCRQLARLDRLVEARRGLAARYDALLEGTPLTLPRIAAGSRPTYQTYVVLLPRSLAERRSDVIAALREAGIEAGIGTCHIPLTRFYRERYGHRPGDFPVTDDVATRALALPLYEGLAADQQAFVVKQLLEATG